MSIDNYICVPAGSRNDSNISFIKYKSRTEICAAEAPTATPHQVLLAHQHLIDEQYFFESADDARWFWLEGYKERLYLDDRGAQMPYDRMALWIGGEEVATCGYEEADNAATQTRSLRTAESEG